MPCDDLLYKEEVCAQKYCLGRNICQVVGGGNTQVVQVFVSCTEHILLNGRMILNYKLEEMWKRTATVCYNVLSQYCDLGGLKISVSVFFFSLEGRGLIFESRTSIM